MKQLFKKFKYKFDKVEIYKFTNRLADAKILIP